MTTYQAAVMPAPRVPVELREFPEPALEPGSVLLKTLFSEICGTDVHLWHGRLAGVPYPIIPGHVSVGVADKVRGRRPRRGRSSRRRRRSARVLRRPSHVRPLPRLHGHSHPDAVRGARVYGITDPASEGLLRRLGRRRSISSRASRSRRCRRRCTLDDLHQRRLRPASPPCTSSIAPRSRWAIPCSCRASAPSASARSRWPGWRGAARVIAFGAPADRLALAREMGADRVVDITATSGRGAARHRAAARRGGYGVDVAIEAAGSARAVEEGADAHSRRRALRDRWALHRRRAQLDQRRISSINRKHLEIRGCWGSEVGHFVRALRLLERHHATIPWRAIGARVVRTRRPEPGAGGRRGDADPEGAGAARSA